MPDLYGRDWRHSLVDGITLKEPASDVLPAHKRRTVGVVVTTTRDQAGRLMSFATPSPVSLALDIAERAAATANLLRVQIKEVPTPSTLGDDFFVSHESVPALFDYFQHCMITVTFSYQALEAFCNATIKRHLVHPYPYKTKQGVDLLDADELERRASTDEKLAVILPHILGVSSPRVGRYGASTNHLSAREIRRSTSSRLTSKSSLAKRVILTRSRSSIDF